jgi:N-acetylglucosamine kinase-like BadF-type ATPase
MGYIIGVDGGNTKSIALIASPDGTILGAARSGCSDIYGAETAEAAIEQLELVVNLALQNVGLRPEDIDTGCYCLAGADWPEDYAFLHATLEGFGFGRTIKVYNDSMGALRAGSPDGTGVIISCGTGIAIAAHGTDGSFWQSGFWIESLGGIELGYQALQAVYRAELGIDPPTALTKHVLKHFAQTDVEELLHSFSRRGTTLPTDLAVSKLAPIVLNEAEAGDAAALSIVQQHGLRLAEYAIAAARKVHLDSSAFPLVLNGGIFKHPGRRLVEAIVEHLQPVYPNVMPVRSRYEPAVGALLLALEAAGITIDDKVIANLESSFPPAELFST